MIRNAELGEITVLSGTTEKTSTDKLLVKRLLKTASKNHHGRQGVA